MHDYLVEYKMLWGGKVIEEGVKDVKANGVMHAEQEVAERLSWINRKAEIMIVATVKV